MLKKWLAKTAAAGALALGATMALVPSSAQAATRVDVGVGIGLGYRAPAPVYVAPAPVYVAPRCEGRYETRYQSVLVVPERRERRWCEPVYETRYYNGAPSSVCVAQGGYREYVVPAQYENRAVQVWVESCPTYVAPTYVAPRYYAPSYPSYGSSWSLGLGYSNRRR